MSRSNIVPTSSTSRDEDCEPAGSPIPLRRLVCHGRQPLRQWASERYTHGCREPKWRNGRRDGLKNRCPQGRVGSTPTFGTICSYPHTNTGLLASGAGSANLLQTVVDTTSVSPVSRHYRHLCLRTRSVRRNHWKSSSGVPPVIGSSVPGANCREGEGIAASHT